MFVDIGVFLMAVSFAIFAVFFAKNLWRLSFVAKSVGETAKQMESSFNGTLDQVEKVLDNTHATAMDVEVKISALNGVFYTVGEVGHTTDLISEELNDLTVGYANGRRVEGEKPFIRIIQGAEFVKGVIKSWKRGQTV
ncbi:DUF948 domain-containing protein [Sporosarcina oncorhynchi]|uniref:DUF948 domain-containing protein n=1 Tax=Sporosarcina oncorhynchi TaxID=3056444 RepID=A0ABZ0LA18_9BACL|nr:DUF948 domain-containing protein [Sporosarcina sp. T2O-4]WOV88938.1 DUF948 domain-containing protein [Sporosarcina sp. T2O-4]